MAGIKNNEFKEIKLRIKKYLELENVSMLVGAGTSFHLGAPIIRKVLELEGLKTICQTSVKAYFGEDGDPSYEDLFNCLQADKYLKEKKRENADDINNVMVEMQKWLFKNCDTQKTTIREQYADDSQLLNNRYYYHEAFVKKLLQRPNNLKRANLFTTNYDMAFDYALDNLGVHYINGFSGIHNRCFRPEVYDYDIYYPGQSVSGKVHRAEKVLRYYKMHGSLSWVATESSPSNVYGIKEVALDGTFEPNADKQIMIYPCVSKKTFTLDLPYSELFRQFAQAITQPQSVLFCIGYSFFDEHINDIIYQALSIPSFTLIIANYKSNEEIQKLKDLNDPRIIVLDPDDSEQTTFVGFVKNVMPDLYEENEQIIVSETMNKLYPSQETEEKTENEELNKEGNESE
jgi:hypothetical protein